MEEGSNVSLHRFESYTEFVDFVGRNHSLKELNFIALYLCFSAQRPIIGRSDSSFDADRPFPLNSDPPILYIVSYYSSILRQVSLDIIAAKIIDTSFFR